jgi:DNA-binding NtrC family response regulator
MEKRILVLDADLESCQRLYQILDGGSYQAVAVHSLIDLADRIQEGNCLAVIMDVDTVPVDNRVIRDFALKYPDVRFLCISKERFHPELKDAICYHIYACLNKPVDPDELLYWIKCIYEDESEDT